MIIYVDIDNTICETTGCDYINAQPWFNKISTINSLYNKNNYIVYWTSRGVGSSQNLYEMTKKQLDSWGCKYHELKCDKPVYDLFIDDKTEPEILIPNSIALNKYKNNIPTKYHLYDNKNICLLGNGESLEKHYIDFDKYDVVVGINRIYQTKYWKNINVLYYNVSKKDANNLEYLLNLIMNSNNFKYIFFCPWSSGSKKRKTIENLINKYKIKNHIYSKEMARNIKHIKKRPLTGIAALNHILLSEIKNIDLYGFDFYKTQYINNMQKFNQHNKFHDLESNKSFLYKLINNYPNKIKWKL
jgi:hypothetical protein